MFGGSNNKRGFVREKISTTEKTISYALLILILGIGISIYTKGQRFDPGLFELDHEYIQNAKTDPRESLKLYEPGFGPDGEITSPSPPTIATTPFSNLTPSGWKMLGKEEAFTADTLYEKINGRAEQYIRYGVKGMQFVGFTDGNKFIDVFVYNMDTPIQAFGIYSVERTEGAPKATLGREGYQVEASYFFWKGPYYGQVIASDTDASLQQVSQSIAESLTNRLNDNGETLWGYDLLPQNARIQDTVQYFKRDALSLDFLTNAFSARYLIQGQELTAFIAQANTPAEAKEILGKYTSYITNYGDMLNTEETANTTLLVGDMGGLYDIVFQKGNFVGGITLAEDRTVSEKMVRDWFPKLTVQ
ncbi:MAG: DUF6599 family protein [Candidatus Latescibacterota bacterium]